MAFTDDVVKQAWERAGAQCECNRRTHSHFYTPCGKLLVWKNRGSMGQGGWEAHQINIAGPFTLSNCEILCWNCYNTSP
jgi:hypothetical protein